MAKVRRREISLASGESATSAAGGRIGICMARDVAARVGGVKSRP
jgi:hypothetical protein